MLIYSTPLTPFLTQIFAILTIMNLSAIQTSFEKYNLVQLDQAPKIAEFLGLDLEMDSNVEKIKNFLETTNNVLNPDFSGVVLDPIYSFGLANQQQDVGLLFRLSTLNPGVDPLAVPQLLPDWGVAEIANNYGLAKIELYYHPQEKKALQKKQLLAELYDYCQYQNIDLFLKLIIYNPGEQELDEKQLQTAQLQAVQEFYSTADILALQFPLEALSAATLTADLDIPWILTIQDQDYEQFKQDLRLCLENGAQGFLLDHRFFKEIEQFRHKDASPDWEQLEQFVSTTLRDRLIELCRIVNETEQI